MPASLVRRFFRRHNGSSHHAIAGIHSAAEFRTVLERERARAERTATSLALITLTPSHTDAAFGLRQLAERLAARKRITDCAGLLADNRAGVLLWNADERGARSFVESLLSRNHWQSPPRYEIFVFDDTDSDSDTDGSAESFDAPSEEEVFAPQGGPAAQPLEAFFVAPLPMWKRSIDIAVSLLGVVVVSPVLLAAAAAIKLTSKGPVFFMQQREGLGGKAFTIFKFRTMCVDAEDRKDDLRTLSEQDGPAFKLKNDPRITAVGRYLRMSCIDELPQILNVLRGEMTLVGPRPLPVEESQGCRGWQRRRLEVTPGLTCIWQVNGKSRVPFIEWMRMDIRYIKRRTLLHDAKLILQTLIAVVLHRGSC